MLPEKPPEAELLMLEVPVPVTDVALAGQRGTLRAGPHRSS
jgi:hypothetical protein